MESETRRRTTCATGVSLRIAVAMASFAAVSIIQFEGITGKRLIVHGARCGSYIAPEDTVSPEMMEKDFDYAVQRLKRIHPGTVEGFSEHQKEIIERIRQRIGRPLTKEEFFFAVNELFHSFHDAHTSQYLPFHRGIELPVVWLRDGIYVKSPAGLVQPGDRIISIGGDDVIRLFEKCKEIVCAENDHLVRFEGQWILTSEPYLRHFRLIEHDSVRVELIRDERRLTIAVPVMELERPGDQPVEFLSFEFDEPNDLAVMILNECRYDEEYKSRLASFFQGVKEKGIRNIAVDLRRNDGGSSLVIDEFLRYMDVDSIRTYGSFVRYSRDVIFRKKVLRFGIEEFPRQVRLNKKVDNTDLLFKGDLYLLVGPNTFSSANMFAAAIRDNRIGTVIGEPTGNQPTCYGEPLSFTMPATGIRFRISHKRFFRPDARRDDEDAIYPDFEVYREIGDIVSGRDEQMERLIEIVRTKGIY